MLEFCFSKNLETCQFEESKFSTKNPRNLEFNLRNKKNIEKIKKMSLKTFEFSISQISMFLLPFLFTFQTHKCSCFWWKFTFFFKPIMALIRCCSFAVYMKHNKTTKTQEVKGHNRTLSRRRDYCRIHLN